MVSNPKRYILPYRLTSVLETFLRLLRLWSHFLMIPGIRNYEVGVLFILVKALAVCMPSILGKMNKGLAMVTWEQGSSGEAFIFPMTRF
jgi:hypothetical protein